MAVFAYKATDNELTVLAGTVVADTPRQARDLLRDRGLSVQDVQSYTNGASKTLWGKLSSVRVGTKQGAKVGGMIRELSTLLGVGIPLLEALDTVAVQHKGSFHAVLLFLRDQVSAGVSLAEAMRQRPDVFDDLCVNIVEVGEQAGNLDGALTRLAEFQDRSRKFKDRVGTALIYPCIVLVMAVGVSVFLMTFVVPNLLKALVEQGQSLPLATRIVKGASDFLLGEWWLIALAAVLVVGSAAWVLSTYKGRRLWHRTLLRMPAVGNLVRKQAIARIATVMSALIKSGIVFDRAIKIAQRTTRNLVIREALHACEIAIYAGSDIAKAMQATKAFPPTVVQIFAVGQRSGRLEEMLDRLAADYDAQVEVASGRLTAVLEPALIVVMVFVVGLIAFATILPILEASNVM